MKTCPICLESLNKYGMLPTKCPNCGADRTGSSSEDFFEIAAELKRYQNLVK